MVDWQLTIDCADPAPLVSFWAVALGYEVTPPPAGHGTWNDHYLSIGVPADELDPTNDGADRLHDPTGAGPRIWFQVVPEAKVDKNRIHVDLYPTRRDPSLSADERRRLVEARVAELEALGGSVWKRPPDHLGDGEAGHYSVIMRDPEGNEFCVA